MPGPVTLAPLPTDPTLAQLNQHYQEFTQSTYKIFGQLMVRAWSDPTFMAQLKANPADVMRKAGIPLPPDFHINPDQFVIVDRPQGVSVEALHRVGPVTGVTGTSPAEMAASVKISCAGSASSFSCPSCTASCAGSGGC